MNIQYFELESSPSSSSLQDELLADDHESSSSSSSSSSMMSFLEQHHHNTAQFPSSSSSWYYAIWKSPVGNNNSTDGSRSSDRKRALTLMTRNVSLIVSAMMVVLVLLMNSSRSPRTLLKNAPPQQEQQLAPAINSSTDTDDFFFGVEDTDDPRYCVLNHKHGKQQKLDFGYMPYATEIDRHHCEQYNSNLRWSQDLRCYSLKSRWCFATLEDGFSIEELEFHHHGCQMKFYETEDGTLYQYDGTRMPDSYSRQAHCATATTATTSTTSTTSEPAESKLWYSIQPKTGCGQVPLRFCRDDGSVHWDLLRMHRHITGNNAMSSFQYNCREFQLIDLMDEGSEDVSQVEQLCQEQVQGCANRLYRGCDGNGKISQELINNDDEECLQFDELDSGLAGHQTDQGVDLICLSPSSSP
ncbi:unnamed protein product [Cylindrotheca closterium]|uniref:Uncharacterized protein n=1 Tax=Cylindrotheca closterium TaxID=2856 RepID=A0AAD2FXV0_9STRA|nr:unnamed protein product [Cylindrotheca closterium]